MRRARTSRPNGKGKLRWEAFADMADRGEIIISFIGEPNQMVAVISTPGERDRYLGGPGVKKLAAHKRKLARRNSNGGSGWRLALVAKPFPAGSARDRQVQWLKKNVVQKVYPTQADAWEAYFEHRLEDYFGRRHPLIQKIP